MNPRDAAQKLQNSINAMRKLRSLSQKNAIRAMDGMLGALRAILDGERLAGMPNLGKSAAPLYAAVVRAKAGSHTRVPLNFDASGNSWKLVLTDRGELQMVWFDTVHILWHLRSPAPEDLRADDPEKLANTIVECIHAHCRRSERSKRRFDRLADFSRRLWEVCEYEED